MTTTKLHVWLARDDNRPGCKCTGCDLIAREPHQAWECPGRGEEEQQSGIPDGFREWLSSQVDVAISPKMAANVWDGYPLWMQKAFPFKEDAARDELKKYKSFCPECGHTDLVDMVEATEPGHKYCQACKQEIFLSVCSAGAIASNLRELRAIVEPLNRLRASEGASIEILCDNPEGPPNCAIKVRDEWPGEGWTFKRFHGASLAKCLKAAEEAKAAAEKTASPLPSPKAQEVTPPACDTCNDTGEAMSMVCYGGTPFERMGPCPDCVDRKPSPTASALPSPKADTCLNCGRLFAGTSQVANRDHSTCWTKYYPDSRSAVIDCNTTRNERKELRP